MVLSDLRRDLVDRLLNGKRISPSGRGNRANNRHSRQRDATTHIAGIEEIDDPISTCKGKVDQLRQITHDDASCRLEVSEKPVCRHFVMQPDFLSMRLLLADHPEAHEEKRV